MRLCQSCLLCFVASLLLNRSSHSARCLWKTLPSLDAWHRFTLTPQRMRMIVEAFTESLELGLAKYNQIVVRAYYILHCFPPSSSVFVLFCSFLVVPERRWKCSEYGGSTSRLSRSYSTDVGGPLVSRPSCISSTRMWGSTRRSFHMCMFSCFLFIYVPFGG